LKNVIISEPRESKKGKKVLDREVVLEKSNGNRESLKITIKSSRLGGQAQTPVDKQKSATNTFVQKWSTRPISKVDQTDFNVSGQKKSTRSISQIGQASCKQKMQPHIKI
jgi:Tfp pilus assembly protein FimV